MEAVLPRTRRAAASSKQSYFVEAMLRNASSPQQPITPLYVFGNLFCGYISLNCSGGGYVDIYILTTT